MLPPSPCYRFFIYFMARFCLFVCSLYIIHTPVLTFLRYSFDTFRPFFPVHYLLPFRLVVISHLPHPGYAVPSSPPTLDIFLLLAIVSLDELNALWRCRLRSLVYYNTNLDVCNF
jgi:hypothetical protein